MSCFEPDTVKSLIAGSLRKGKDGNERVKKFEEMWSSNVKTYVQRWTTAAVGVEKDNPALQNQWKWTAAVMAYVNFVHSYTSVRPNNKKRTSGDLLPLDIPLMGPRFTPLPPILQKKRSNSALTPFLYYLKPVNVIHPFYDRFLEDVGCPGCRQHGLDPVIKWQQWGSGAPRHVHGLHEEEYAVGFVMECETCKKRGEKPYSHTTTNVKFWAGVPQWKIPAFIPLFAHKSAMTRQLADMLIEMRLSMPSGTISEHIKQLHLSNFFCKRLEYLRVVQSSGVDSKQSSLQFSTPEDFSPPFDPKGYGDAFISADLISEAYTSFSDSTRKEESNRFCRSLNAITLSLDHTIKLAKRAKVVSQSLEHKMLLGGGWLSLINEDSLIVAWRLCQTGSYSEITSMLTGYKERCSIQEMDLPESCTADNCCTVRPSIQAALPGLLVNLDTWHFVMRYTAVIVNGKKNPCRSAVSQEITNAILAKRSDKDSPAIYRTKEEQETRLVAMYSKWADRGTVWSKAAKVTHANQLAHVRNGCLTRHRNDVQSDGSRIEGLHKHLNGLQRSHKVGLRVFLSLAFDFVLRHNVRLSFESKSIDNTFIATTHGSHHLYLVDACNNLCNRDLQLSNALLPVFPDVLSGEQFGLLVEDELIKMEGTEIADDLFGASEDAEIIEDMREVLGDELKIPTGDFNRLADPGKAKQKEQASVDVKMHDSTLVQESPIVIPSSTPSPAPTPPLATQNAGLSVTALAGSKRKDTAQQDEERLVKVPRTETQQLFFPFRKAVPQATTSVQHQPPAASTSESTSPARTFNLPRGLTPTQLFFQLCTGVDPNSLHLGGKSNPNGSNEFFLFMRLRKEAKWQSSAINWNEATNRYNKEGTLHIQNFTVKDPRALRSALKNVEDNILKRIATDNYKSQKGGEEFWKMHCNAVDITPQKQRNRKVETEQRCTRCERVKYPGGPGSPKNHKKFYCDDGVNILIKNAPYPQPAGIFSAGNRIDLDAFKGRVHSLLKRSADSLTSGKLDFIALEDQNLAVFVHCRLKVDGEECMVDVSDLNLTDHQEKHETVNVDGKNHYVLDIVESAVDDDA